jgi:hypothetical protein
MRPGETASRKRIETRLLTRQQKEWVGYSYIWNDEQTEAVLVEGRGRDKDFFIRDDTLPGKTRKQTWHYPSRTECMVCHSRAAGFVLGLTEAQMNKTHQYGATTDNQLRVLEHLGVLESKWLDYERDVIPRELAAAGIKGKELSLEKDLLTPGRSQREAPPDAGALLPRRPENLRKLADPADASASLGDRARSYLQANCAHCHVEAGGGNSLMDLEFLTAPEKMRIFDIPPQHHTFEITDARLIAPGHPEKSVLLRRMANRDAGHMPPLATSLVDREAVELITQWISGMK